MPRIAERVIRQVDRAAHCVLTSRHPVLRVADRIFRQDSGNVWPPMDGLPASGSFAFRGLRIRRVDPEQLLLAKMTAPDAEPGAADSGHPVRTSGVFGRPATQPSHWNKIGKATVIASFTIAQAAFTFYFFPLIGAALFPISMPLLGLCIGFIISLSPTVGFLVYKASRTPAAIRDKSAEPLGEESGEGPAELEQKLRLAGEENLRLAEEIDRLYSLLKINLTDDYEFLAKLGEGGAADVQKWREKRSGKEVAVKFLRADLSNAKERELVRRFQREIEILREIKHPNIVEIYAWGIDKSSQRIFYVMEFVGNDVANVLGQEGQFSLADAVHVILEVVHGLQNTTAKEIVHRDLKPENLLITAQFGVKISDFGTAYLPLQRFTTEGHTMGTPAYMSPEQLAAKVLDLRSDIFSLGAIFYRLLTRKQLFEEANHHATVRKIVDYEGNTHAVFEQIDRDISQSGVAAIIKRMIAPKREDRYQTYEELTRDLESLTLGKTRIFPAVSGMGKT